MAKYGVAVRTVNRWPKPNYIRATFEYLKLGGVFAFPDAAFIVADSGSEDRSHLDFIGADDLLRENVEVDCSPERIDLNRNFSRALRLGAAIAEEYVVLLEDDIEVCDHFMERVDAFLGKYRGEGPVWSFYQSYAEIADRYRDGFDFWKIETGKFYGTQCIVVDKMSVLSLAESVEGLEDAVGADIQLGRWLEGRGVGHIFCSVPSYVQHIGRCSSISSVNFHRDDSFGLEIR